MRRFQSLDVEGLRDFVERFQWRRTVTEVHLHHTWRPTQQQYRGPSTIEGMWRHHTQTNGWSDIAQHVSVGPEGAIWLCRNFNWSPASALGFNGNAVAAPGYCRRVRFPPSCFLFWPPRPPSWPDNCFPSAFEPWIIARPWTFCSATT